VPTPCDACAQQEATEQWDLAFFAKEDRESQLFASLDAWRTAVGDLPVLRSTLAGAVSALRALRMDPDYWRQGGGWFSDADAPFHVEEQVRFWLLDVPPEDRVILERLARDLYRAQVRVLVPYAEVDKLTPKVRARVTDLLTGDDG
jgi:hypothetical protein